MNRPDDVAQLPRRHRDYIAELEREVERLKKLLPPNEPTNVFIVDYGNERRFLQAKRIGFEIGKLKHEFHVSMEDGGLKVYCNTGGIAVHPDVSNVITIVARKER